MTGAGIGEAVGFLEISLMVVGAWILDGITPRPYVGLELLAGMAVGAALIMVVGLGAWTGATGLTGLDAGSL